MVILKICLAMNFIALRNRPQEWFTFTIGRTREESDVLWNCVVGLDLDCLPYSVLVPELGWSEELGLFPFNEMILFV